ncbi:ACP S-malonyltransferase [Paenarthrobacter aurescens]|uniref:[acyl-carrier-protein] S-malonyltransferase n=1 Tax=Paenarthrobacter aurescens TaxID=43663 RepID=A0A4Y3NF49_PAEAU|nr:ACP S-malonyltransferase [Paenarthrobacter aurescens]UKA52037.1 ACP S-malonyltransferase [Arthrobacter sp. FW305-123]MDO6143863.1 ACP S-malonyltransferase [Paenarthrobacter aurescens]MDO6147710.1 ACP S-malonyltransferase [Paenarthrobacter aurescens]MDO6158954.1 ACP S-malonyltransferase [Paenarthrobacter aurescens]MDO6162938.1 ACP S-malonyltransferase [Paenarthrobacter aurescens]
MLAIVCPGQGSQTPGFLAPWLELPSVEGQLAALSEIAGIDLKAHGTTSDEETIKDTAVAQPLIVAAGLVAAKSLFDVELSTLPVILAGHSVGEITASALAGVLTESEAMTFVRERANSMAAAAAVTPTGMSAVVGGDPAEVLAAIEATGATPANVNGAGQTVAAGTFEQLKALAENPPAKARVIPLKVAGAFHTSHMAPAVSALEALKPSLAPQNPAVPLLSNFDGKEITTGTAAVESLIAQVSRPVRWDLCMETLVERGVTGLIELAPAGTLAGLAKRGMPGVKTVAVKTPDDLSAALALFAELEGQA